MRSLLVHGTYCIPLTSLSHAEVSAESVTNAFRTAPTTTSWGEFVGPAPRITRARLDQCPSQVNASWLFEYPDPSSPLGPDEMNQYDEAIRRNLQERLQSTLRSATSGGGWVLSFLEYSPSLHGTRDWWASGTASRTRTYQSSDSGPRENPVGPDEVHPPEIGLTDRASQWIASNKGLLIGAGVVVGVGVVAAIAVKVLDRMPRRDLSLPYGPGPMPGPYPIQPFGPMVGQLPPVPPYGSPPGSQDKQLRKTIAKSKSQLLSRK